MTLTRAQQLAWAGGIFDGEGCISIGYVKPTRKNGTLNPSYRLTVKVTMGHEPTIRRFAQIIGSGEVHAHVARGERVNASWSWVAMARKAERALRLIEPYLFTKERECEIALRFMALPDVRRGGKSGSPRIDLRLLMRKHALYLACAKAKPRARFRLKPLPEIPEVHEDQRAQLQDLVRTWEPD